MSGSVAGVGFPAFFRKLLMGRWRFCKGDGNLRLRLIGGAVGGVTGSPGQPIGLMATPNPSSPSPGESLARAIMET